MQIAQRGDRVQVHYVKRLQNGGTTSSQEGAPIELTVGIDHPRLPGLGLALVGLAPGTSTKVRVPSDKAYGAPNPARVHRLPRTRFPKGKPLAVGKWVRIAASQGRRRLVRIVEVSDQMVVVDANHPWAGQALELEVKLVGIQTAGAGG